MSIENKYNLLISKIKSLGKVAIAYSGGVDSTFLLKVLVETLGRENTLACICASELMSKAKLDLAIKQAQDVDAEIITLKFDILTDPEFTSNPPEKCYVCKKKIYSLITAAAKERGFDVVTSGTNYDDLSDYRPGNTAARENGVIDLLAEVKLTKSEIRQLSRKLGLPTADVPSTPCNASRIPYGHKITGQKLQQVGAAEEFLKSLGFIELRVRHYESLAKIELPEKDIEKAISSKIRKKIVENFKAIGFKYVSIDLQGFRSGALNEDLKS